ncbi:MAG: DUF7448 domain-containing protein [Fusobacteriaceae bacterium]
MIEYLINKTITKVEELDEQTLLRIHVKEGGYLDFVHIQDCCECVWLEDGFEELKMMEGQKVLSAYNDDNNDDNYDKYGDDDNYDLILEEWGSSTTGTWTFYNISTKNTDACLRFIGVSNGNYSETVELRIKK